MQIFYLLSRECLYVSTDVLFLVASQNSGHRTVFFDRYLRLQASLVERYCHAVLLQPWIINWPGHDHGAFWAKSVARVFETTDFEYAL